jgi:hypothetical protein
MIFVFSYISIFQKLFNSNQKKKLNKPTLSKLVTIYINILNFEIKANSLDSNQICKLKIKDKELSMRLFRIR